MKRFSPSMPFRRVAAFSPKSHQFRSPFAGYRALDSGGECSHFVLMNLDEDGQLHTLGLIEELRAECKHVWGASSELYFKIEELLRELSNPNLHGIFPASAFQIELWDRHAQHVRWVIAASASVTVAQAALDVAISEYPNQHLTLRKGAMVLREHAPGKNRG